MDELENTPLAPKAGKKRSTLKKILIAAIIGITIYAAYSIGQIFISPDKNIQQVYLVPKDAAFIIQSSDPIKDWSKFSQSDTWKTLKQAKSFAEVATQIETFDSIIQDNSTLLSLVGKRDLLVSIHKTRPTEWDFLILLDLQKMSKVGLIKDQLETILKVAGQNVTYRKYKGIEILETQDLETKDRAYIAFVNNHLAVSFTSKLVEAAIDSRENPTIGLNPSFIEAEKQVSGKGLLRLYINYAQLPRFMTVYLGARNEYLDLFSNSMDFAGLYFNTDKEKMEIKGYTLRKDTADPYITALLSSGKHKMKAHEVMSARTALYTNIGFSDPTTFVKELENALAINDKKQYDSYSSSRKKIESLFDLSLEKNFLSWMSGEFAISQLEPGLLGREPELILAIRTKSQREARKNMEIIEKKIKNRTPIRVKSVEYKEYEINYIEMKGFFRLFFGSLFDKFEKPYYTYVDDYVLFSNKASTLLSYLEDYEQKNLLGNNPGFQKAYSHFESGSTLFLYADIHKFYPQLKPMLNYQTWSEINENKDVLYSFPYWSTQIVGDHHSASLHYVMDYEKYDPQANETLAENNDPDEEDETPAEDAETPTEDPEAEKELMSEVKRFYVEKFQGNILREFYPEGALKSETEIKDGKRHGRHREYHENGKLKCRGKYANNRPKGTWKYYTEEGKFESKEKF